MQVQVMAQYIAAVAGTGRRSKIGPFLFEERCFTDSDGHQVIAWGCMTSRGGRTCRRARTRAHALGYWLSYRLKRWRWRKP